MKKSSQKKHLVFFTGVFFLLAAELLFCQQTDSPLKKAAELLKPPIKGRFAVTVHYSLWTLDPLKSMFKEDLIDSLSKEIRKEIARQSRDIAPGLVQTDFEQSLAFDSSGGNYGIEIRYYPGGRAGAFSLGFALEKTSMRLSVQGPIKQEFADGTYAEAETKGILEIKPFSSNLNFRWDMAPSWIVSPYFVMGLGIAPLSGSFSYDLSGSYTRAGLSTSISELDDKPLKEAEEEMDFNIPNIFVIIQAALGLRAEIASHLVLNVEAGLWDGILIRWGLGVRF